jgi:Protein of unknown function (DUF2778)
MHAYKEKIRVSHCLRGWVRVDTGLAAASIATLVAAFGAATNAIGPGATEPQTMPEAMLVAAAGQTARAFEPETVSEPAAADARCATFDERFYFDLPSASFDERFASAFGSAARTTRKVAAAGEHDDDGLLQQPDKPTAAPPILTPVTASRNVSIREERLSSREASLNVSLPLDSDSRTAIYDIAARTVYLPDGRRLEAHSGLGSRLDNPRYVSTKMQGPTPPNVYNLTLRERLFHGVRAIRLVPVDDGKMFGRDGILAHTYMLGPNGQSNGCVSFRNYDAFLSAFLKGEVNRLVVVEHLATTARAKTSPASGG